MNKRVEVTRQRNTLIHVRSNTHSSATGGRQSHEDLAVSMLAPVQRRGDSGFAFQLLAFPARHCQQNLSLRTMRH